jgi:hypothetical protein
VASGDMSDNRTLKIPLLIRSLHSYIHFLNYRGDGMKIWNFISTLVLVVVLTGWTAKADNWSLPSELVYSISGSCTNQNISFRALDILARSKDHPRVVEVYVYLNENGTGAVSLDSGAPVVTTWSFLSSPAAPDILNIKVEKIGTIQYVSAQMSGSQHPDISLQTVNSYFPDLPVLSGNNAFVAFQKNLPISIAGQTAAAYCGH